jgi:hypothetical protein
MTETVWLFPNASLKGDCGNEYRLCIVPNWFPNDNLWKKSRIEAKCGIFPY